MEWKSKDKIEMSLLDEYKLYTYQDYGPLQTKDHIHLVRNQIDGQIYIKKILDVEKKQIYDFLKENPSLYIPKIKECVVEKGKLIVIEEYITGRNLEDIVSEGCLLEKEVIRIAMDICCGLMPLHNAENQIICRDLKAANVMISLEGEVKLIDFNIARIYREGKYRDTEIMGTVGYAAPEQFGFFQTDGRVDIYAIGVLMNFMLTGEMPQKGVAEGNLKPVIERCILLNPLERYQTVEELYDALKAISGKGKNEVVQVSPVQKNDFTIPGFRTKKIWKMIIAVLGYLFLIWICVSMEFHNSSGELEPVLYMWMIRIILLISGLVEIGIVCNYRNCQEKIPVLRSKNKIIKALGCIFMGIILFFLVAIIAAMIEIIFWG